MSFSSAGSKTSSLISTWGVTENKGEESSLPSFQHWHHLGAEAQQKPDLALGSLHSWVHSALCPVGEGKAWLPAEVWVHRNTQWWAQKTELLKCKASLQCLDKRGFPRSNSLSMFWNGFSQWRQSLQHPYFWLFMEKALHRAVGTSTTARSGDVSIEWWRTYLWLIHYLFSNTCCKAGVTQKREHNFSTGKGAPFFQVSFSHAAEFFNNFGFYHTMAVNQSIW